MRIACFLTKRANRSFALSKERIAIFSLFKRATRANHSHRSFNKIDKSNLLPSFALVAVLKKATRRERFALVICSCCSFKKSDETRAIRSCRLFKNSDLLSFGYKSKATICDINKKRSRLFKRANGSF